MNKQFLTEILDRVTAVHVFISVDLTRESLSPECDAKRQKYSQLLDEVCNKIRSADPSMRPRVNTPASTAYKPPPPDPIDVGEPTVEEDMYTEFDPSGAPEEEPENYLEFSPSQTSISQEVYMAMDEPEDLYEEPKVQDGSSELYEEPISVTLSSGRPSTSSSLHVPTPSQSRENSASGAELIESTREKVQLEKSNGTGFGDTSMDWGSIYSPIKGDKVKVNTLQGVSIKGLLEKLGGRKQKTWQRRYCVMAGVFMYFYEKESSKTYNNYIVLPNFTVSLAPDMTEGKKKHFAFKLSQQDSYTGKSKSYYFRAISAETRDKWVTGIQKTAQPIPQGFSLSATTLPRMTSNNNSAFPLFDDSEMQKRRSMSLGGVDDEQEVYEDMPEPIREDVEEEEDYLPVSPGQHGNTNSDHIEELSSSAEYVDVQPNADISEEEYEDTTNYQTDLPPPPLSPPPGPPTVYTPPTTDNQSPPLVPKVIPSRKAPPPPPSEPVVDTEKVHLQETNGIVLGNVYHILWNFKANETDELALSRGDLVLVDNPRGGSEWWYGELLDREAEIKLGKRGLFPREYSDRAFEIVC